MNKISLEANKMSSRVTTSSPCRQEMQPPWVTGRGKSGEHWEGNFEPSPELNRKKGGSSNNNPLGSSPMTAGRQNTSSRARRRRPSALRAGQRRAARAGAAGIRPGPGRPRPPRSPGHALTVRLGAHQQRHPLQPLHVGGGDVPRAPVVPLPILVEGVDLHPPTGVRHGAAPASGLRAGPGPAPPPGVGGRWSDGGERGGSEAAGPLRGTAGPLTRRFPWLPAGERATPRPGSGPRWRRSAASAATAAPPPSCNPTLAAFLFLPARPRAPLAGATAAGSCRRAAGGTAAAGRDRAGREAGRRGQGPPAAPHAPPRPLSGRNGEGGSRQPRRFSSPPHSSFTP